MTIAYVGLGGNVGEPADIAARLRAAAAAMGRWEEVASVAVSGMFATAPVGPVAQQAEFINAAARLDVRARVGAWALLRKLLRLEGELGRTRDGPEKGPRTVDLDLLLFGDRVVADGPRCVVPHPALVDRAFALEPLRELAGGDLRIPGTDVTIDDALARPAVSAQPLRAVVFSM